MQGVIWKIVKIVRISGFCVAGSWRGKVKEWLQLNLHSAWANLPEIEHIVKENGYAEF